MSELKDLVPPLDLCKQIPVGAFADSALVWMETRTGSCGVQARITSEEVPAPTLAEIMVALARLDMHPSIDWFGIVNEEIFGRMCIKTCAVAFRTNPATATLKLWLELEGGK